ncbi:hypothetical protein [Streptomyces sp. NPDC004538]|uniref:hypothetical protein n=1 Tax=Streptomyces sp. NPDC004538 TaxID=3154279 RepID=UPI0033A7064D
MPSSSQRTAPTPGGPSGSVTEELAMARDGAKPEWITAFADRPAELLNRPAWDRPSRERAGGMRGGPLM